MKNLKNKQIKGEYKLEKLYWKIKHDCKFDVNDDYMETILKSKGIEDIGRFLNVNKNDTHSPSLFKNIDKGLDIFHNSLGKGKKIYVQPDSDVDGYTSSSYMVQFIADVSPETEVVFSVHTNKEHGLLYKDIKHLENVDLFIVPDASVESEKECLLINENFTAPILILDHHEIITEILPYTTLINCMDGQYPNPTLSGVGVVHKFCLAYCEKYGLNENYANQFIDLVALGMIADSVDMRNLETRYYTLEGLKEENRKNLFIKELSSKFADDMKLGHTITSYGWVLAPKINGCVRYGKPEEQLNLFRAMCGEVEDSAYQPRRPNGSDKSLPKPPIETHSLQKTMARVSANAKARQDTEVRKVMKEIDIKIESQKLQQDSVIIVDGTELLKKKTLSGLVANKLTNKYKRPVLILNRMGAKNVTLKEGAVIEDIEIGDDSNNYNDSKLEKADVIVNEDSTKELKDDDIIFGGSARGYSKGKIKNLKEFMFSTGYFIKCAG